MMLFLLRMSVMSGMKSANGDDAREEEDDDFTSRTRNPDPKPKKDSLEGPCKPHITTQPKPTIQNRFQNR